MLLFLHSVWLKREQKKKELLFVINNGGDLVKSKVLTSISSIDCLPNVSQAQSLSCQWSIFRRSTSSFLSCFLYSKLFTWNKSYAIWEPELEFITGLWGPAASSTITSCCAHPTGLTGRRSLSLAPLSPGKMLTSWHTLASPSAT